MIQLITFFICMGEQDCFKCDISVDTLQVVSNF